ncbi:MAG: tetratricopeptide repeat protein [Planctomycetaceae bacterium]
MQHALAVTENNTKAHLNMADYLKQEDKTDESEAAPSPALEIDPEEVAGLINLGNLLSKTDRAADAVQLFEKAETLEPENVNLLMSMGNHYQLQKEFDKAVSYYQKAIDIAPEEGKIYSNLAMVLTDQAQALNADQQPSAAQQKLAEAYATANEAVNRKQTLDALDLANTYNTLGILNMIAKRPSEGLKFFKLAVEADPTHPGALSNLKRAQGSSPR